MGRRSKGGSNVGLLLAKHTWIRFLLQVAYLPSRPARRGGSTHNSTMSDALAVGYLLAGCLSG